MSVYTVFVAHYASTTVAGYDQTEIKMDLFVYIVAQLTLDSFNRRLRSPQLAPS